MTSLCKDPVMKQKRGMHLRWHPTSFKVFALPVIFGLQQSQQPTRRHICANGLPPRGQQTIIVMIFGGRNPDRFFLMTFKSLRSSEWSKETKKRKNVFFHTRPASASRRTVKVCCKINHNSAHWVIWKSKKMVYLCIGEVCALRRAPMPTITMTT